MLRSVRHRLSEYVTLDLGLGILQMQMEVTSNSMFTVLKVG